MPPTAGSLAPPPDRPLLVGREREQHQLREALVAARSGRGALVLIGGVAGIGKTALAEALLTEAPSLGAGVLLGRCYDLSETPPYGPWAEALARAPHGTGLPPLPTVVLPHGRDGEPSGGQETIAQRIRVYLAALAARQPLVLLLDDLHWADPESLNVLRLLARDLGAMPLLLLATYRAEEVERAHPLTALLPLLVREAAAVRVDLRALDSAAIDALVAGRYALARPDRMRLTNYLVARTEGHALFLGEMLRTLENEGLVRQEGARWVVGDLIAAPVPPLLRQVIAGRMVPLAAEVRRVLAIAAVIGQGVPLDLWAAVAGLDEGDLLDLAERATAARLLAEMPDGSGVRFPHALIREAVYEDSSALRRRGLHRQVGKVLAARARPDPDAVAYHLQLAGDAAATAWLVRAGLRAYRATAHITALDRFVGAAARLIDDVAHVRQRAWLLLFAARLGAYVDIARSLRYLDEAMSLALTVDDPLLIPSIRCTRGQQLCMHGEIRRGIEEAERGVTALELALPAAFHLRSYDDLALTAIETLLPEAERGEYGRRSPIDGVAPLSGQRASLLHWLMQAGHYRRALSLCETYIVAVARDERDSLTGAPRNALGHAYAALGRPADARREYGAALASAKAASADTPMVEYNLWYQLLMVMLPYYTDLVVERTALVEEARRAWEQARRTVASASHDTVTELLVALVEGRWDIAHELARDTLNAVTIGHYQSAVVALATLARNRGDHETAWARIRELHPEGPETEPGNCWFGLGIAAQLLAADLALDVGDRDRAGRWIAAHARWLDWSGAMRWRAEHDCLRARHAWLGGDLAGARAHAEAALARAAAPRQPLALIAANRLLGELATAGGRAGDAPAYLDVALTLAEACAAPYERALTLLAVAELRLAEQRDDEAAATLAAARAILLGLGARPALARADELARRLASRPVEARAATPLGLTTREVEVLRLVAHGLTNAQVAEQLFVTSRTINAHLTSIYGKLGVEGRAAAIRRALDNGLG